MTIMKTLPIIALSLLLSCCGDDNNTATADATPDCTQDPRAQPYSQGMGVTAEDGVQVVILDALPQPPVRFDNVWSIQLLDNLDQPLAADAFRIEPYMPDHGHGTPKPPVPIDGEDVGVYDMGPFDLWMPGIWELRVAVDHEGTTSTATFTFCIEE